MENKAVSFEEFTAEARRVFKGMWPDMSDKEVDEYLNGEEAQTTLKNRYEENKAEYEMEEITRIQFLKGGGGSAGNCLALMYD